MHAPRPWRLGALLLATVALCGPAQAQQPPATPAAPAAAPSAAPAAAPAGLARLVWATAPVSGLRWPGSTAISLSAEAGARLEVVAEEGELLRVRLGTSFGWVPKSSVQATEPTPVAPGPGEPSLAPPAGG